MTPQDKIRLGKALRMTRLAHQALSDFLDNADENEIDNLDRNFIKIVRGDMFEFGEAFERILKYADE